MRQVYIMVGREGVEERAYSHRRSAVAYARRRGLTITEHWPESDPPPDTSDARAWDDWRTRRGYAGVR